MKETLNIKDEIWHWMLCDCAVYLQAWDDAALNITVNPLEVRSNQNTSSSHSAPTLHTAHWSCRESNIICWTFSILFSFFSSNLTINFLAATKISPAIVNRSKVCRYGSSCRGATLPCTALHCHAASLILWANIRWQHEPGPPAASLFVNN